MPQWDVELDNLDTYIVWCFRHKNKCILMRYDRKRQNGGHWHESSGSKSTTETSQNVEDVVARWAFSTDVKCSALATTAWTQAAKTCGEVTSGIFLSWDTRIHAFSWWDDLGMFCNGTMDAKWGIRPWFSVDGPWIPRSASHLVSWACCELMTRRAVTCSDTFDVHTLSAHKHSTLHSWTDLIDFQPFSSLRKRNVYKYI